MDDELVLVGVDVRNAIVQNREMQMAGRDLAAQQLMGGARVLGARLALGIGENADGVLLEFRAHADGTNSRSLVAAPLRVFEGLGGRSREAGSGPDASGAREHQSASQKGAAVQQAIARG